MKEEKEKINWHCAKCDGTNVPHHFRTCEKREITKMIPLDKDEFWGYWDKCEMCEHTQPQGNNYCSNCGRKVI